ncbi:MAG: response regulator transcription factor [Rubricoccaceae bacterium]
MSSHILVVGGHAQERDGLAALLSDACDLDARTAATASDAIEDLDDIEAVVLYGQASLPGLRVLRAEWPTGAVVVLVTDARIAYDALQLEALGAVHRSEASEEVFAAVRAALAGEPYISGQLVPALAARLREGSRHTAETLSRREREVLALYGAGLSREQIAEQLSVSLATVSSHRDALIKKLRVKTTTDLIRYAEEAGFGPLEG